MDTGKIMSCLALALKAAGNRQKGETILRAARSRKTHHTLLLWIGAAFSGCPRARDSVGPERIATDAYPSCSICSQKWATPAARADIIPVVRPRQAKKHHVNEPENHALKRLPS